MSGRFVPPREPTALEFHISLAGIEPAIWRRIQLPPDASMWDLHVAIQDAMGWQDYHLHEFAIETAAGVVSIGLPTDEDFKPITASWEVPVALVFREPGVAIRYVYDFGDDWVHAVVLEKVITAGKPITKPRCVAGARACPPEDCGGLPGYMNLLKALGNRRHPEHEELREWAGDFQPERFDPKRVKFDDPSERLVAMFAQQ